MAMFELEDSEDVKISRCKTDSETLIKGKGLPNLKVKDCEAGHDRTAHSEGRRKVFAWIMTVVTGVLVIAIASWLGLG
ncbi:hypothetical protein D3C77_398550 [compost metagenome]